ncbi:MAG TPA: FGGY family carbohydrate kinase, partial [Edaphobacter sp.]|nr:FGGY family carbohydrate kinase [Edaphobacter sp.]
MAIVAGVDYGTLNVRVTLLDSERGRLSTASAEYPLHRRRDDPDYATQSHADHLSALVQAMKKAIAEAKIDGGEIAAVAIDTTGSSVIPVDKNMQPLDEY